MNKEQQNLAWACLPKETRDEIKKWYGYSLTHIEFEEHLTEVKLLNRFFGQHNLNSDTEPEEMPIAKRGFYVMTDIFGHIIPTSYTNSEEMLIMERKKVQRYKAYIEYALAGNFSSEYSKGYWHGQKTALDRLFGDKCLPDKEPVFSETQQNENNDNVIVGSEN